LANKKLVLASAGAGKTEEIISEAVTRYEAGETVLLLTYTQNNQLELQQRIARKLGAVPDGLRVKGWFTFLLEDLIRPYQLVFFKNRIENVYFNESNPHKVPGNNFQIPGRTEYRADGQLNSRHFLTRSEDLAHTAFLSKLACRISEAPDACSEQKIGRKTIRHGFSFQRLKEIYDAVIFDEVQDLTGWDYQVLEKLSAIGGIDLICVGDFRQTIYLTHHDNKKPSTNAEKIETFVKLGFESENKFVSRRCVQPICKFADSIHESLGLPPTKSLAENVIEEHLGVFAITQEQFEAYYTAYEPTLLRNKRNVATDLCKGREVYNFGEAKGLQFPRTLIIPTPRQQAFLNGNDDAFNGLRTDQEINRFYVAVTRAQYSTAILWNGSQIRQGACIWVAVKCR